jgi:hypothetical protein
MRDVVAVEPVTGGLAALAGIATRQDAPPVFVKAFRRYAGRRRLLTRGGRRINLISGCTAATAAKRFAWCNVLPAMLAARADRQHSSWPAGWWVEGPFRGHSRRDLLAARLDWTR